MKKFILLVLNLVIITIVLAQGELPRAISKDLHPEYEYIYWRTMTFHNDTIIEGYVTLTLPQKNNCYRDTASFHVSFTYYSKSSLPTADEIAIKKEIFDNGAKDNHKNVFKSISLGTYNGHDIEYVGCSELSYDNTGQIQYFYYDTQYKCRGYADGVTNEILEQKFIEHQFAMPDSVLQQLFKNYNYTDIYMTARADKELDKKYVSIVSNNTFTYEEAFYHTKRLMDYFLSFDYETLNRGY
jgi:hypothetical protein